MIEGSGSPSKNVGLRSCSGQKTKKYSPLHRRPYLLIFCCSVLAFLVVRSIALSISVTQELYDSPNHPINNKFNSRRHRDRNWWKRVQPSHGGTVFGESDDFRTGKSCLSKQHPLFFWKSYWVCRDCGKFTDSYDSCPELKRSGKCPGFSFQDWDGPRPRSASTYDPEASSPYPVRLLTSYGVGKTRKVEYEQAQCRITEPCFQLRRRCIGKNGTLLSPIAIYAYPGNATTDLSEALGGLSPTMRVVQDPNKACLLIAHHDNIHETMQSSSWNGGRNHYIYGLTKPITDINYEMAALGSVVATDAQFRSGYDISLPLPALWSPPTSANKNHLDLHRPRRVLLSFKGSVQDTLQPYYQHRWLAAEYWYGEKDVEIDVQCKHKTLRGPMITLKSYDHSSRQHFDDLMINATFGFCPGGSHVTSFRFTEVLSVGGVPVILPEVVAPFAPEMDWSGCVVRVSQARVVDLPRILRAMPAEEIHRRQKECQRLYRFIQNEPGKPMGLTTPLKVWVARIQQAVQSAHALAEFNPASIYDD